MAFARLRRQMLKSQPGMAPSVRYLLTMALTELPV